MAGEEKIVPERLVQLANDLDDMVGPELYTAMQKFTAADISGDKFSQVGVAMLIAYPGSREWAIADANSDQEQLRSITDKLAKTANLWATAEQDNTVICT